MCYNKRCCNTTRSQKSQKEHKLASVHISFSTFIFIVLWEIMFSVKDQRFFTWVEPLILLSPPSRVADLLLVVSPAVPQRLYGQVLTVCERRGFGLLGLQRLTLQRHGAAVLGLSNQQVELQDTWSLEKEEKCYWIWIEKAIMNFICYIVDYWLRREFYYTTLIETFQS